MKIFTAMKFAGNKVTATIQVGTKTYHANSADGRVLERAINDSHAVKGLDKPENTIMVHDDNSGSKVQYPIARDKFLSLLAGYGVRHEVSQIFG